MPRCSSEGGKDERWTARNWLCFHYFSCHLVRLNAGGGGHTAGDFVGCAMERALFQRQGVSRSRQRPSYLPTTLCPYVDMTNSCRGNEMFVESRCQLLSGHVNVTSGIPRSVWDDCSVLDTVAGLNHEVHGHSMRKSVFSSSLSSPPRIRLLSGKYCSSRGPLSLYPKSSDNLRSAITGGGGH